MAFEIPGFVLGVLPANSDMSSTGLYRAVKASAAGAGVGPSQAGLDLATTGDPAIGILQNNPVKNEAGAVMCSGVSKALAGATITVGQQLMASTSGVLVPATSTNNVIAIALEAAASGDVFAVLVRPNGKV